MTTRSPPVTRSKLAARVYEDYTVSPSEPARTMPDPALEPATANALDSATAPRDPACASRSARTPSVCSRRSTASTATRIKQAELEAQERLFAIRREEMRRQVEQEEMRMEAELIKKRLAVDIAAIQEESVYEGDLNEHCDDTNERVTSWLSRGEGACSKEKLSLSVNTTSRDKSIERTNRVTFQSTPAPQKDSVDRLADAIEKIARNQTPYRHVQELPTFSGDHREWLPFRAALRDLVKTLDLSASEVLARLRISLKGEAKQTVAALLYTATEPSAIIQTLEQCYGRPEVIVDQAIEELRRIPRLGTTTSELNTFAIKVQNIVTIITNLDDKGYLHNHILMRSILEKLSPYVKARWYDYAYDIQGRREPGIVVLSRFLMCEADKALRYGYESTMPGARATVSVPYQARSAPGERIVRKPVFATKSEPHIIGKCFCCGSEHRTTDCPKLKAMPVHKRWEFAKETRVCFQCLNSKHRRPMCKQRRCGIGECRQPHHTLLHPTDSESENKFETVTTATAHTLTESVRVLLKVCPVTVRGANGAEIKTYALLDEGSTITLIDEEIAAAVGAEGPARALNIVGATSSQEEPSSRLVSVNVKGQNQQSYTIEARTVRNLTLGQQSVSKELLRQPHLSKLPGESTCYENAKPRLLIGADNWHLIVTRKLLTGKRNQPAASLTQLGWIIHGSTPSKIISRRASVLHVRTQQSCVSARENLQALDELIKSHYDIDALGISQCRKTKPSEERAKEIIDRTVKRVNGRFEVGLPWVSDDIALPPSYDMALRRLRSIEKKMDQCPAFKKAYTDQVEGLFSKGYAKQSAPAPENTRLWYLPHFAVTNPNKPGKIRMVFDAAAKSNGVCLNDVLLDGPDLLQSLNKVLFGFRAKRVAVTADIREMFLRIKIRPDDQVAQHFLWRGDNRREPPQVYVMSSMIFGARSSPFIAHSIRDCNAADYKVTHPIAYSAITKSHYMDDWLDSFDNEEIAAQAIAEVRYVHRQAGFELASWSSNYEKLLDDIPRENRACAPRELAVIGNSCDKALGILWTSETDELGFNTEMNRVHEDVRSGIRNPTKREALGAVMSIFDPLGLLSPYTITAKIMLQQLWRQKVGWDESLPPEEAVTFAEWLSDLATIKNIRIPRCYDIRNGRITRTLHVFCDASEQAYAAVAYWQCIDEGGYITVSIIAGKAKVAPLKLQSIPRMELQAALIGARLAADIIEKHPWSSVRIVYWTDSKTVLQWIRYDALRYTPFVAHRLGEIAERTQTYQWRWVPTKENPADDATRAGGTLDKGSRWFTGPQFLYEPEERWPMEIGTCKPPAEVLVNHIREKPGLVDVKRFSSYDRLVRAVAYALLFIDKCRKRACKLTLQHLTEAERLIIKEEQSNSFAPELANLIRDQSVSRTSRLFNLDPMYASDKIIRLNSRNQRNLVVLDGRGHVARLIIDKEHRANHIGREQIVNNLRQRYWILHLRPTVRTVVKGCVTCKARKALPKSPVIGNLPPARLQAYTRPFTNCGIDCYGPMWVTIGRRREKRWGMLFTCLVTRAVHIELIASLNTDSAINAIRRMAARRGMPRFIISDNGTNFRGADVELRNAYKEWLPAFEDFALTKRFEWRYTDPGAPNQGGAWERLIRSVKSALRVILNDRAPKEEVLLTLTTEIEHTINSRPLTHVSVSVEDPEALTPNHFLLGSSVGVPYIGECEVSDKRAWRQTQALANSFWARWVNEYLPTLSPRGDHRRSDLNVKVGDLVIIVDGLLPRNVWPRGIVEKTYSGPDGVVRSVEVRTKGGVFRRPVRRIIVLPIV